MYDISIGAGLKALGQRVKEIACHSYDLDHEQQKMVVGSDRSPYHQVPGKDSKAYMEK